MYAKLIHDLERLEKPLEVIVCGLGFMGFGFISSASKSPYIKIPLIITRRADEAVEYLNKNGIKALAVASIFEVKELTAHGIIAVSSDITLIKQYKNAVVLEVSGTVDYGTQIALATINSKKHLITMNPELQATVGHKLKALADKKGVLITDVLGDQPGSLTRLISQARLMGFEVIVAGNMKRYMDERATQSKMQKWADDKGLNVRQTVSFTDGTKQSIEMNLVANYYGMKVMKDGMVGTRVDELKDILKKFDFKKIPKGGIVDYVIGLNLFPGIFVIAKHKDPNQVKYLRYLSLGDGPYYLLFEPYHLCHLEVMQTIASAALYKEVTINNSHQKTTTMTVAKKNLKAGDRLDGIGGDMVYGQISNFKKNSNTLPVGLAKNAILLKDIKRGEAVRMSDVTLEVNPATVLLGLTAPVKKRFSFNFNFSFPNFTPSYK